MAGIAHPIFGNLFDDEDEDFEEDECMEESSFIYEKNNRSKERSRMSKYREYFSDEALKGIDTFDIGGENFLLDPPQNALLHIELE